MEAEYNKSRKLAVQQSNPEMPQVLDYVNQKAAAYDAEAEIKDWKRKVCTLIRSLAQRPSVL